MNDQHDNEQTDREMLSRHFSSLEEYAEALAEDDKRQFESLTNDIMSIFRDGLFTKSTQTEIHGRVRELLTRRIREASQAYDAQLKAGEMHSTDLTARHDISDCEPDYCGRYPGQRRDSRNG
jgi:hypothetical protein